MSGLTAIDADYTVVDAAATNAGLAPLTYHAYQAALQALGNIAAEIKRFEKDCKAMDQYIRSGDFSMSSERAQTRLKERGAKVRQDWNQWHAKFDGRKVLPKP